MGKNEQGSNRGQFEILSRHLPGGREENYKNLTVWQKSLEYYATLNILQEKHLGEEWGGGGGLLSPVPFPELPKSPSDHRVHNMWLKPE
jgi:hypothetical protein